MFYFTYLLYIQEEEEARTAMKKILRTKVLPVMLLQQNHTVETKVCLFSTREKLPLIPRSAYGLVIVLLVLNLNTIFSYTADGFDEGLEEDIEDDFEHILAENIDGATQRRFVCKFLYFIYSFRFDLLLLSTANVNSAVKFEP